MQWIIFFILILLNQQVLAHSCQPTEAIIQKPIIFDETRIKLTKDYQHEHYGIDIDSIEIDPKMIVLHWTALPTMQESFDFLNPVLSSRSDIPDKLNVSAHYLVDRDGTIYQLMPDHWMARHVIGLNHNAIGIENVGGVDGKPDLTGAQVASNSYLVCLLKHKYPNIKYVIGHYEYLGFKNSSLWLEKNPDYQTMKFDPGYEFKERVQAAS